MCYLLPSWKLPCLPRSFSLPCLPRSFTTSALHHPNVLDLPFLSDLRSKAKLTLLISIPTSNDPFIEEITSIHKDESYCASQKIPRVCIDLLHKARLLVSSFTTKSINIYCRHELSQKMNCGEAKRNWNLCQSTELEDVNNVWKRITQCLPSRSAFIPAESRHRHTANTIELETLEFTNRFQLSSLWSASQQFTTVFQTVQLVCNRIDIHGDMTVLYTRPSQSY